MSNIPSSCFSINEFKNCKEYLAEIIKEYSKNVEHSQEEIQDIFSRIANCYKSYKQALKNILQERKIILYLPSDILKKAQEEHIIEDADIWLEYISDLNEIIQSQIPTATAILQAKVVEKYIDKPQKSWKYLEKFFNEKLLKKNEKDFQNITLSNSKPEYKPEEMGLNTFRYNEFINFCKKHKNIKNVWLYGPRADGNYTETDEIRCIVNINNIDEYKKICFEVNYLPIPNQINFTLMQDLQNNFFTNTTDQLKIIYRSCDFEE